MNTMYHPTRAGRLLARLLVITVLIGSLSVTTAAAAGAVTVAINSQFDCAGPVHSASWTNYSGASWNSWVSARVQLYYNDPAQGWIYENTDYQETWYGSSGSAVANATAPEYSGEWSVTGTHNGSGDLFTREVNTYAHGWC